jgi:hypothetical protein
MVTTMAISAGVLLLVLVVMLLIMRGKGKPEPPDPDALEQSDPRNSVRVSGGDD